MKIIKKPESINVTTVGNPTISNDFIVSNFSSSNWIVESSDYTIQYDDIIEINLRYKCNSYGSWGVYLSSGNIYLKDRSTSSFEYAFGRSGYDTFTISHSLGNWYRLKIIQEYKSTSSNVTFSLSADEGQTWTTKTSTITYNTTPKFNNIILCQNPDSSSEYLRGELDLKECNIKINNNYIWQGVTPEKYYYIHQNNKYYGIKDLNPNPPANVIFDEIDSNNYITYKSQDGQSYWRKSYSGLCYSGFCVFEDGGNNWIIAFTISEVQNNCIMYRDSNQNVTLGISSTTLNYKGKNWYYSINNNANRYNNPTSTMIDFNKNNGRYWIGGENKIYTGSDNNEKFIQVAKDFLDYIYSF